MHSISDRQKAKGKPVKFDLFAITGVKRKKKMVVE